jgi:multidrug efflux pump subunit AcrB
MSIIPFGLIGAVLGHWLMGINLSIGSVLGMLALIGVMVNDSLVLVDYINQRRRQGIALLDAVLNAGVARFRPVLLTSLTTFFGLLPLLLERSISAQFLIPMAASMAFGILFSTLITLLMVPANVMIAEDGKILLRRIFARMSNPRAVDTALQK